MTKVLTFICVVALFPAILLAQAPRPVDVKDIVDIEMLTHSEIYDKIHKEGKTSVIIANGGTEQRGPHAVLGGHTIMAHHKGIEIARKLGNALVAPSSPFAVSASGLSEATPGGVSLPSEVFKAVNAAEVESMATNGFKDIFLMGDHGGGQNELKQVAEEEDRKLSGKGVHVYYISDFYSKSHDDFDEYSYEHKIPIGSHAGVSDTSEMLYWEPSAGTFVRPIYKTVPFNPGPTPEQWKAQQEARRNGTQQANAGGGGQRGQRAADPNRVTNGITGDPHMSSKELGKIAADISINNAVAEIKKLMAEKRAGN
jgi:creatinine amidohydrolase/Fe(II)-dependent formamide hydrolase-like protein